jgi:hypothetical protein
MDVKAIFGINTFPNSVQIQRNFLSENVGPNPQINPLTPELNPSAQRCLTRFFTGGFASSTVHFVNTCICVKNQQMQQLFIQFINYVL